MKTITPKIETLAKSVVETFDEWIPYVDDVYAVPLRALLNELLPVPIGPPKTVTPWDRGARTSNTPTLWVTLPRIFADDHTDRGCKTGRITRQGKTTVSYRISDGDTFDDWLSDANVYRDPAGMDFANRASVSRSAKRAYKTLDELRATACRKFEHDYYRYPAAALAPAGPYNCRRCKQPAPQHYGELPHGIGCPGCEARQECNHCERKLGTMVKQRTEINEAGKRVRYQTRIGCTSGRCPTCCTDVCRHETDGGLGYVS